MSVRGWSKGVAVPSRAVCRERRVLWSESSMPILTMVMVAILGSQNQTGVSTGNGGKHQSLQHSPSSLRSKINIGHINTWGAWDKSAQDCWWWLSLSSGAVAGSRGTSTSQENEVGPSGQWCSCPQDRATIEEHPTETSRHAAFSPFSEGHSAPARPHLQGPERCLAVHYG